MIQRRSFFGAAGVMLLLTTWVLLLQIFHAG